ncbi:hypothetical protein TSUD_349940 [Trifolium subterraneum]|uniref:RNase H type-1 domain-containing protein n=1 Tax=Trifolium subterraneum TaxID=3900 RepID=A0A2Z6NIH7_TRISU|nr:hypothetical protein TSUD_349940 [Trifolium subterraneum]
MPTEVKERLSLLPINLNYNVSDCFTWKDNLNELYTARDGYHWLNRNDFSENPIMSSLGLGCGASRHRKKIKFFLWTALHKAIPTKAVLSHRGILHDSSCPRCNNNVETTIHCLRDCDFAKSVWKYIGFTKSIFFQDDEFYVWLRNGLDSPSKLLFTAAIWWICVFLQSYYDAEHLACEMEFGSSDMILNVDESSIGNPGVSGFGGLIRNSEGAWAHGFAGNICFSNILHVELMALYHGILLAWQLNIKELWCYSDFETAIKLIIEPVDEWHHYAAILLNINDT